MGSSTIFAISRGIAVGAINVTASGVTGRTLGSIAFGGVTATAGSSTGGGGEGGGGPIGDTRVINSSRWEMLWGKSNGITRTMTISSPWKITEPITDGFWYLSFSGNVAGNSLKMTASDILPPNDLSGPCYELLPANGFLQYV